MGGPLVNKRGKKGKTLRMEISDRDKALPQSFHPLPQSHVWFLPARKSKVRLRSFSMELSREGRGEEGEAGSAHELAQLLSLLAVPEGRSTGTWHLFHPAH